MSKSMQGFGGLFYQPDFVSQNEKQKILSYLKTLYPIWEMRFSKHNPPPAGQENRRLLRPVYWLGNWQFACLNYYHPPKGLHYRCVEAEPFCEVLAYLIRKMESQVHDLFLEKDIPRGWHFNTCLINYYGDQIEGLKKTDMARVGEHKDFEPGPVGSLSFGERALIQFVKSQGKESRSQVVVQQWLEDCSLQIFGGDKFKKQLFHRVQRVERKTSHFFDVNTSEFETRRINFTFRYVPNEHIQPLSRFPNESIQDVQSYVIQLAKHSSFFEKVLAEAVHPS